MAVASEVIRSRHGSGSVVGPPWRWQNLLRPLACCERDFVHVNTDSEWTTWAPLLGVRDIEKAAATRDRAQQIGPRVVIEWGFKVAYLPCVRMLRDAGFDAWWFDGEEAAARQGYISRHDDSPPVMAAYLDQANEIQAAWPELQSFYGNQVVRTVTACPTYMPFTEIFSLMFPNSRG